MDEDTTWEFNAPQYYCDLPSAVKDDDSEQADQYFFAKTDDTVYYDYDVENDPSPMPWNKQETTLTSPKELEEYPVIRRRSRSVGSRPLFIQKSESLPLSLTSNQSKRLQSQKVQNVKTSDDPDQYFIGGLRSYQPVKGHQIPKVTKPVPFNLTAPKKKNVQNSTSNPSMAEGVQKWEKKTPERFHTSRQGEVYRMVERVEMRCTEAHTPQLMAVKRHRPVHALSREEKESCELEEMKRSQFKAHGVDERIFKPPVLPAKKEGKATKIEPFHLSETHKKENVPPANTDESDFKFHAKPAPKFDAPTFERKQPIPVTIPHTPKFSEAGKASLHSWRRQRSRSNGSLGASHSSSNGSLTSSTGERLKNTIVEPFSFEDRDKMSQRRKETKLKKLLEEERKQREFHANPCPNFSNPPIPERPTFTTTRPLPFQLSCDTRGASKKEKFLQQIEEMRLDERKAAQFKAQPAKVLVKEPFRIHKPEQNTSQLTAIAEFSLTTAKRAEERKQFDQFLKERELEKEMNKVKREQEQLQKEAEEIARLREETVFVAKPVRHFKSLEIKKAETELLTVPKTPKFMKK